ncbi:hypothetical protein ACE1B6_12275 [Aerosakkonemataceae cyanobacterium BLCC-F154]|uniref:Uncharacterized protein n=1 Tax=Floridaenema fluviatile BLCC-F154 TaxID=3153640 RepID=A0ABV4YB20_9CYAN
MIQTSVRSQKNLQQMPKCFLICIISELSLAAKVNIKGKKLWREAIKSMP